VYTVWGLSLVLGAVVVAVVVILLALIARTASRIETVVADVWTAGQRVANNTIHIALLRRTNATAGRILDAAGGVQRAAAAIHAHARGCPRCPACAAGGRS
jgi:hypothetical protein